VGDTAGATGGTFGVLRDPVLNAGSDLAFQATLAGRAVAGLASATIWWQPATASSPTLLAQGGKRPGLDLAADAQWRSFSSLGIADNRGPIFAGTLVVGKGGVKATTASGVWATDFTGAPRLLFRTGDTIAGKQVKSFTLLNATVGSTGVTRSFNSNAQVAWRATFIDGTQALVTTEIP
jgi:hypothetical protein